MLNFKFVKFMLLLVLSAVLMPNLATALTLSELSLEKDIEYFDTIVRVEITCAYPNNIEQQNIIIVDENNNDITEQELKKMGSFQYSAKILESLKVNVVKTVDFKANMKLTIGGEYLIFISASNPTPLMKTSGQIFQFDNSLNKNEDETWVILPDMNMIMPSSLEIKKLAFESDSELEGFTNYIAYELINWKQLKKNILEYSHGEH